MYFRDLSFIRELPHNHRLESLVSELSSRDKNGTQSSLVEIENALRRLQHYALHLRGHSHSDLVICLEEEPGKVIISRLADGVVYEKRCADWYNAYRFLNDFLGLDKEKPITIAEIEMRYHGLFEHEDSLTVAEIGDMVAMKLFSLIYDFANDPSKIYIGNRMDYTVALRLSNTQN